MPNIGRCYMNTQQLEHVLRYIETERYAQDEKWGGATHDDSNSMYHWLGYITKQAGCIARSLHPFDKLLVKGCLIKIAALAVAAIQSIERQYK